MYIVPNPLIKFELISCPDGIKIAEFSSIDRAVKQFYLWWGRHFLFNNFVGDGKGHPVYKWNAKTYRNDFSHMVYAGYKLVSDYTGEAATTDEMYASLRNLIARKYFEQPIVTGQPVPGVRKHRGGHRCHRKIRSHQLHAQCQSIDYDEPAVRAKVRNTPDTWDDLQNSSLGQRSWKRYRKTQYK